MWDRNTGNGMTEGADAAYDAHSGAGFDREERADRDAAFFDALTRAKRISDDTDLMAEAVSESKCATETTVALCVLLSSTDVDARRKARQVLAAAIANLACWQVGASTRELLDSADQDEIAKRIAEQLP